MAIGAGTRTFWEVVVLAAGAGVRFGGGKLLAPWRGRPLIEAALAAAAAAPARSLTVAAPTIDDPVAEAAWAWAEAAGEAARLRIVAVPDAAEGMSASLRRALVSLPADAGGAFVFLGDMPRVPAAVLPRLARALSAGAAAAAPSCQGKRGHPVLLGRGLIGQAQALQGDAGARALLAGLGSGLALVETDDDGVLFDVDRPSDLT